MPKFELRITSEHNGPEAHPADTHHRLREQITQLSFIHNDLTQRLGGPPAQFELWRVDLDPPRLLTDPELGELGLPLAQPTFRLGPTDA